MDLSKVTIVIKMEPPMNKLEYTQELLLINLYQLFDLVLEFQEEQGRTLNDVLDIYMEPLQTTPREWLRVYSAIANNPNLTIHSSKEEIDEFYSEELFQEAIKPYLDLSIKTIKHDGYTKLENYQMVLATIKDTTMQEAPL
jgi:hypothetical protein